MQLHLIPMTLEFARCIVLWKYEGQYALYNYDKSAAYILDAKNWGSGLFAVVDEAGDLVGELTVGFVNDQEEWVSQADLESGQTEDCMLWIGLGLRPDLTGRGIGPAFVSTCADFAIHLGTERYGYKGAYLGLRVYQFNQRAIKVYERVGFEKYGEGSRVINGEVLKTQNMRMPISHF